MEAHAAHAAHEAGRRQAGRSAAPAFTEEQMAAAMGGFSDDCKIDEGKFSIVYRGRMHSNRLAAIKMLN